MNTPEIGDLSKLDIIKPEGRTPEEAVRELIEWYENTHQETLNTD